MNSSIATGTPPSLFIDRSVKLLLGKIEEKVLVVAMRRTADLPVNRPPSRLYGQAPNVISAEDLLSPLINEFAAEVRSLRLSREVLQTSLEYRR
jgi:hypothetical protein